MDEQFQGFFEEVAPLRVREPLAETLGAFAGEPVFTYRFGDLVKLAGHACPTMAGSWLACNGALAALYGEEIPVRGQVAVTAYGGPDEGTFGVMGQAFMLLCGAAPATGFKGLGPLFRRKDLLTFSREKPDGEGMCFEFRRTDTGAAVLARFSPRAIPFPAEKARRMGELMEKVVWEAARPEEAAEFRGLWMGKVKMMLVDRTGIESWLTVERRA
jgi:hypothetical protein